MGIFGLSLYTTERELKDMLTRYGPVDEINLVYDHQTGRSRGFAFVYMRNVEDAIEVNNKQWFYMYVRRIIGQRLAFFTFMVVFGFY